MVRINGLLVPDGLTPAVDDGQEAQELGAALGYVTLFLDLAAAYLGSPLLHRVRPACSILRRCGRHALAASPVPGSHILPAACLPRWAATIDAA